MRPDNEAPSGEEFDEFCEVLVGPDGDRIFALHQIYAWREPGDSRWTVDEHKWRVEAEWTDYFPEEVGDWRWGEENRRLAAIPEVVARVQRDRGLEDVFLLAWDVSDNYRVQEAYLETLISVFDSGATLPAGLTGWLTTPPGEVITLEALEASLDPRREALTVPGLDDWLHAQATRPSTSGDSLRKLLLEGVPHAALFVVPDLLRFTRWLHVNGPDRERHG